jgi:hypothetical protein
MAVLSGDARARRSAFGRGFRHRTPLVLAVAALLAVGLPLLLQHLVVGGGIAAVPEGRLLRIANDDYLHVAYRIAELKREPPEVRTVYLFGGSGTMECIVDEASLADAITRGAGEPLGVVSLAAHQQSMAMSLALVDNLPLEPAVVAVGLAPRRLYIEPEKDAGLLSGRPLLMRSPRLESLAEEWYGRAAPLSGAIPGILDYLRTYVAERWKGDAAPGVRLEYAEHYYPPGAEGHLPLGKRKHVLYVLEEDVQRYARNADYNMLVLEEILRLARERGHVVVLYDQPLNASAAGPDWAGLVPLYRERVRKLAREYGVAYLQLTDDVDLHDDDFADLYHLLDQGRAKWQPEMARQLAAAIRSSALTPVARRDGVRIDERRPRPN